MRTIVKTVAANLFRGIEAVGGHLDICEDGLLFRPHAINVQSYEEFFSYADVLDVQPSLTLRFIPNGLTLTTKQGIYHFVVWRRKKVVTTILAQLEHFRENDGS